MGREVLATLNDDQWAVVEAHVREMERVKRGLSLALVAVEPTARNPEARLDIATRQIYRDVSPVTGSSTITRKGGERDAEGR